MLKLFGFLTISVLILAKVSAQSCDLTTSMMQCAEPVTMRFISPNEELQEIKDRHNAGRDLGISERQVRGFCKSIQNLTTCATDYVRRCVPQDNVNVQQLARGIDHMMTVCDSPSLFTQVIALAKCGQSLQNDTAASKALEKCADKTMKTSRDYYANLSTELESAEPSFEMLRDGRILNVFCCWATDMQTCTTLAVRKCTTEAFEVYGKIYAAFREALGCAARTADGCPAQTPQ